AGAVARLGQGAPGATRTGPATPRAATWMCAAIALPVRLLNSSRHDSSAPVPDFVSVAVNVPRALPTSPFGVGVSFAAVIPAAMRIVFAWLRAAAPPTAARASASASAPASRWTCLIPPPPVGGIALRPPRPGVRNVGGFGLRAACGSIAWDGSRGSLVPGGAAVRGGIDGGGRRRRLGTDPCPHDPDRVPDLRRVPPLGVC